MLVREGHASGGSLTASTVTATYFQGARGPEYRRDDTQAEVDSQGRTVTKARWYVYDGLGSVVGEVDPLGNLTSSPKYDVYGATRSNGGTASSKQGFVGNLGHVSDDTGLVYMRARYYDSNAGRFVSEDPGENGNNWLAYCENNPVNHSDETGKYPNGLNQKQWDYWTGIYGNLAVGCLLAGGVFIIEGFLLKQPGGIIAGIAFIVAGAAFAALGQWMAGMTSDEADEQADIFQSLLDQATHPFSPFGSGPEQDV